MSNLKVVFSVLLISLVLCAGVHADTVYVDADAQGTGNGSSWTDAYTDLQDAINAAASGDEVWVAKGTYYPTSQPTEFDTSNARYNHFALKNGVTVYGGFDGSETVLDDRDVTANETILSGDIDKDEILNDGNAYHVFFHPTSLNSDAVLDGVTVTGGYANGSDPHETGGGM